MTNSPPPVTAPAPPLGLPHLTHDTFGSDSGVNH